MKKGHRGGGAGTQPSEREEREACLHPCSFANSTRSLDPSQPAMHPGFDRPAWQQPAYPERASPHRRRRSPRRAGSLCSRTRSSNHNNHHHHNSPRGSLTASKRLAAGRRRQCL